MKLTTKTIIAGAIILVIGLIVVLVAGGLRGWDFSFESNYSMRTYVCDENIGTIDVDFSAGDLDIEFYSGDKIKVEYPDSSQYTTHFSCAYPVPAGQKTTLFITSEVKWYNTFFWFHKVPKAKVYLPKSNVYNLDIDINAGTVTMQSGKYNKVNVEINAGTLKMNEIDCTSMDVELNAGSVLIKQIVCSEFMCKVNAGDIYVESVACSKNVTLNVSAGSVKLHMNAYKNDWTIYTKVSAGSCNLDNQRGLDDSKTLDVTVSAGSVDVSFSAWGYNY